MSGRRVRIGREHVIISAVRVKVKVKREKTLLIDHRSGPI